MSGIFPQAPDGGLPPNPSNPLNPSHAFAPAHPPVNTSALYYGNGCDVRLRPEVVNSLISEMEAINDRAGVAYDANRLINTELAIRYLIQRGLPKWSGLSNGPQYYTGTLDPAATAYNDGMVLTIVPNQNNAGPVYLSFNALPYVPLLRNDLANLGANDLRTNAPLLVVYFNGAFHAIAFLPSQIWSPSGYGLMMTRNIDGWIRPDGNDANDGTANDPAHAFRTIEGAYNALSRNYVPSAQYGFNLRLGIPGDYDGAGLSGVQGAIVNIIGDTANQYSYRIHSAYRGASPISLLMFGMQVSLWGVTIYMDIPGAWGAQMGSNGVLQLFNVVFEQATASDCGPMLSVRSGATCYTMYQYMTEFRGNGHRCNSLITVGEGSRFVPSWANTQINTLNTVSQYAAFVADSLGLIDIGDHLTVYGTATGAKHAVQENAVLRLHGQPEPGDTAGVVGSGGQVIP